jgi:hypothetical protein
MGLWSLSIEPLQVGTKHLIDAVLQRAAELASARRLDTLLAQADDAAEPLNLYHAKRSLYSAWTSAQRLRRALEIIEPEIQTYGTAGFSIFLSEPTVNVEDVEGLHTHGSSRGPFPFLACSRIEALCRRPRASSD